MVDFELNDKYTFRVAKVPGIYTIINRQENRFYIGQSLDIKKRWKQHINDLRSHTHCNNELSATYNKYGDTSLEFKLLLPHFGISAFKTKLELLLLEDAYINKYKTKYNLYNKVNTVQTILNTDNFIIDELQPRIENNDIIKYNMIDTILNYDIIWVDDTPDLIRAITIDELVATSRKITQYAINRIIDIMPESIQQHVIIKSVDYNYHGEIKTKRNIIIKNKKPILDWLATTEYKPKDQTNRIYEI